ncbi:hypothetical protein [Azospirillum lipoferum]|uniref:hypothetical protein n=1 Tax=Azospirillum lipoferum TaxID=193 RepID=UPI000662A1C5|nr:hypothetical protein [Azospirillum lipoferum]
MEIRGVSSTTAVRPTAFQPTEAGVAVSSANSSQPAPIQTGGTPAPTGAATATATGTEADKASGAGYISPYMRYDQGARVAVLYFRDFETGETQDQIPSQRVVEEYRRAAGRLAQDEQKKSAAATQMASGDAADPSAGSSDGTAGTASGTGSAATRSTGGTGSGGGTSLGVSFASATVSSGPAASASAPSGVSTGTSPATGGFTPVVTAGGFGGSPGGLVSVTV